MPLLYTTPFSPVAQSVEQVTVNHWVGGSSPSRGANSVIRFEAFKYLYCKILFHTDSSPPSGVMRTLLGAPPTGRLRLSRFAPGETVESVPGSQFSQRTKFCSRPFCGTPTF